jgi:hypothetical protein
MSERALEFVETWVSEKIEEMEELPAEGDQAAAKALANECMKAALDEGIPAAEIQDAFDNLAEFIGGEIEEARERDEDSSDDGIDERLKWEAEDAADDDEDEEDK